MAFVRFGSSGRKAVDIMSAVTARGREKAARRREKAEQGCGMNARRDFPESERKNTGRRGGAPREVARVS